MSADRQPDVEIYVKRVAQSDILKWVSLSFLIEEQKVVGTTLKLKLSREGSPLTCTIAENVAKGGYSSIWFESTNTPWRNDEACAQEAFDYFKTEVRCSVDGWTPESGDTGGWYRFTDDGRTVVNWLT